MQTKLRVEKEKEIRASMLADQSANVEVVQHKEAELAAARAKRREDEAIQSKAEAASEAERIKKLAAQAEDSAELTVLRDQMLVAKRELAHIEHNISEQRSKLQAAEARLSVLRVQESERERGAAEGFATGRQPATIGTAGGRMHRRGQRASASQPAGLVSSNDGGDESSIAAQLRADMDAEDEEDNYVEESDATKEKLDNIQNRLQVSSGLIHFCVYRGPRRRPCSRAVCLVTTMPSA